MSIKKNLATLVVFLAFLAPLTSHAENIYLTKFFAYIGDEEAQFNLGLSYHDGIDVEKDLSQCVKWYTKAIENGSLDAANNLGLMYEDGDGVIQDYYKAAQLYTLATAKGSPVAHYNLGRLYYQGTGVNESDERALQHFEYAFNDNPDALYYAGCIYLESEEVPKDYNKAFELLKSAHKLDHADASNKLGEMYAQGLAVKSDRKKAFMLYQIASEKGSPAGMSNLAQLYMFGFKDIPMDDDKAKELLKQSCSLGYNDGCNILEHFDEVKLKFALIKMSGLY